MLALALRLLVALLTFAVGVGVSYLLDFKRPADVSESCATAMLVAAKDAPPPQPKTGCRFANGQPCVISGGVLNGKAIAKPMPAYPPIAKAAKAQGTVVVQIFVDEEGNVTSASAISGHPLLQQAAVYAARQAKFSPTRLSGQPVKVSGVITYNFVLE